MICLTLSTSKSHIVPQFDHSFFTFVSSSIVPSDLNIYHLVTLLHVPQLTQSHFHELF